MRRQHPVFGHWVIVAIVLFTILGRMWHNVTGSFDDVLVPTAATSTCAEDDPCWDCATMGNRICGPKAGAS